MTATILFISQHESKVGICIFRTIHVKYFKLMVKNMLNTFAQVLSNIFHKLFKHRIVQTKQIILVSLYMSEILEKILQKTFDVSGNTLLNYSVLSYVVRL